MFLKCPKSRARRSRGSNLKEALAVDGVVQRSVTLIDSEHDKVPKQTSLSPSSPIPQQRNKITNTISVEAVSRHRYTIPIPQTYPTSASQQCRSNRPARRTRLTVVTMVGQDRTGLAFLYVQRSPTLNSVVRKVQKQKTSAMGRTFGVGSSVCCLRGERRAVQVKKCGSE